MTLPPALAHKLGPFPVGVWVLIVGGGLYVGWRRRQNVAPAPAPAGSPSTPSAAGDVGSPDVPVDASTGLPVDVVPYGPGIGTIDTGAGALDGVSTATPTGGVPITDNGSWRVAAVEYLVSAGVSPLLAEAAVYHYLNGDALTSQQADAIDRAERKIGPPPDGLPGVSIVDNPPATTSTGATGRAPTKPAPRAPAPHVAHRAPRSTSTAHRKPPKPAAASSYTVRSGDTLSAIAAAHHVPGGWPALYRANAAVIESTAKEHGRASSDNGHWIYPGTVLRVPA